MALLPRGYQPSEPAVYAESVRTVQIEPNYRSRHPQYADFRSRLRSFDEKVVPRGQDVQELASAGFFHVGKQRHLTILIIIFS